MNMDLTSEEELSEEFDDETMQAVDVAMSMGLTSEPTNEDFKLIANSQDSSNEVYTVKHNSSDEYIKDGKICYDESLNEQKETSSQQDLESLDEALPACTTSSQNLAAENDEDIFEKQFLQQQPPEYDEDSNNLLRNDLKEQVCKILKKCGKLSLSFFN